MFCQFQSHKKSKGRSDGRIIITTASCDRSPQPVKTELRSIASASTVQPESSFQPAVGGRLSLPNLTTTYPDNAGPSNSLHSNSDKNNIRPDDDTNLFQSLQRKEQLLYWEPDRSFATSASPSDAPVSAVNLKTGSNVFSLDSLVAPHLDKTPPNQFKGKRSRPSSGVKAAKGHAYSQLREDLNYRPQSGNIREDVLPEDTGLLSVTPVVTAHPGSNDPDLDGSMTSGPFDPEVFREFARETRSVYQFNKIAYPDLYGRQAPLLTETQNVKKPGVQRYGHFHFLGRWANASHVDVVVAIDNPPATPVKQMVLVRIPRDAVPRR